MNLDIHLPPTSDDDHDNASQQFVNNMSLYHADNATLEILDQIKN